jgi:hypothetical protein
VYEKLKGRPGRNETFIDKSLKFIFFMYVTMHIYIIIFTTPVELILIFIISIEMFLVDPYVFVDREGNKQNLTEIEFTLKVAGPIIDIIFSDVQHLVQLKW